MEINREKLEQILLENGYIREEDVASAKENHFSSTVDYLLQAGLLSNDLIGQAISEYLEMEYADLNTNIPTKDMVFKIPKALAYKYRVVLFAEDDTSIELATDDPEIAKTMPADSEFLAGKPFVIKYSLTPDIDKMLSLYRAPLEQRLNQILEKGGFTAPSLLKNIFTEALQNHASDIHFEPHDEDFVLLRFRIDGVLQDVAKIPKEQYEGILNKIKIDSQLRIDKHDEALDGALRFEYKDFVVDLRISIVPTINGEKIVIRVLSSYIDGLNLDTLGLTGNNEAAVRAAIKKPYGMIIVTGPTGSGKTTTLYSLMRFDKSSRCEYNDN
jgi:type IV pilus assembly protein PilB